ncbi:hypothetical protein IV203_027143 [Nitzschia inconspicua]|uniref:Uncharacterized protein n=1 Tax=Nitzschia inconspicua TaxID=303405 RepID=A0A9K3LKM2_9STRA|nr:hypothetical protein IV203_027143 [Nitzschia inconspicua]
MQWRKKNREPSVLIHTSLPVPTVSPTLLEKDSSRPILALIELLTGSTVEDYDNSQRPHVWGCPTNLKPQDEKTSNKEPSLTCHVSLQSLILLRLA